MTTADMPFDTPGSTELQTIMASLQTITASLQTITTAQVAMSERMNRIEARQDRIIDAQHGNTNNIPVNTMQFTVALLIGLAGVVAILWVLYYGGSAG